MLEEAEETTQSDSAPIESEEAPDLTLEDAEQVESPEPGTDEETEAPEETESKTEPRDKRIAGFYTERSRADQLERENAELKKSQQPAAVAPNYDDFDTDAEYYTALAGFTADQKIEAFEAKQAQGKVTNDKAAAQQSFIDKAGAANIPDYDKKANLLMDSVGMRPDTLEALYEMEGDKGPRIIAYLADHLDIADGISPGKIGELAGRLSATKPAQQTKASDPIKPIKPGGVIKKKMSDMSVEEIIEGDLSAYGINDR